MSLIGKNKQNMEKSEIFTVKQSANYLQVKEYTIYNLIKLKKIPAIKINPQWRFKKS
ncbi:hypothetical protein HRbin34_00485 [bacterium HR34]|nr:hypothetical protein HRbin34_00485 [bacterium HR34]